MAQVYAPNGNPVTTIWFDKDGNEVPRPALGGSGEITEYDDLGDPVLRTYIDDGRSEDGGPSQPFFGFVNEEREEDHDSRDWIKEGTWDVRDPLTYEPVKTVEQYQRAMGFDHLPLKDQVAELCRAMQTVSWDAAPDVFKQEAYEFIRRHRAELGE